MHRGAGRPAPDRHHGRPHRARRGRTPVIVYCASGIRSAYAETLLRSRGYASVANGGGLSQMMARV
ncbi:MAG: rhodanese-like domain-containing protein [Spirochaetota bacterium]